MKEVGVADVIPVGRSGHPLADAGPVDLREVVRFPVAQGSAPRWLVRRVAEAIELGSSARSTLRNAAVVVNEFGVIRSVVALSDAVGFVPRESVESDIERGLFREIILSPEHRALLQVPLLIATLEDRVLPGRGGDGRRARRTASRKKGWAGGLRERPCRRADRVRVAPATVDEVQVPLTRFALLFTQHPASRNARTASGERPSHSRRTSSLCSPR